MGGVDGRFFYGIDVMESRTKYNIVLVQTGGSKRKD
jgi:hypothetical protein